MARVCLAPTQRTNRLATAMLQHARRTSGAEAVAEYVDHLEPEQLLALMGVLLTRATKDVPTTHRAMGRPPIPLKLTDEQRTEFVRRWWNGDQSALAHLAYREHRRLRDRERRLART